MITPEELAVIKELSLLWQAGDYAFCRWLCEQNDIRCAFILWGTR